MTLAITAGRGSLRGLESATGRALLSGTGTSGKEPVQGVKEIRGRLCVEVWADEPLASAKRIGRELGPWTETQRARREKRALAGSQQVLVPETLDRDSPK